MRGRSFFQQMLVVFSLISFLLGASNIARADLLAYYPFEVAPGIFPKKQKESLLFRWMVVIVLDSELEVEETPPRQDKHRFVASNL